MGILDVVLGPQAGISCKSCLKSYIIYSHRRNAPSAVLCL